MEQLPQTVEFARNFSVMVRVNGPDPKGLKMRNHAFHHYQSGRTTLSASGMLLPDNLIKDLNLMPNCAVFVTVASVVEPFLTMKSKEISYQDPPQVINDTKIDVMAKEVGVQFSLGEMEGEAPRWFRAEIFRLVDVPASSFAIQSLIGPSSATSEHSWEVGWSLASHSDNPQKFVEAVGKEGKEAYFDLSKKPLFVADSVSPHLMGKAATRIALFSVPDLPTKGLPKIIISPCNKRGDALLAMGSPFGILSPVHFFNSISLGSISNCYPPTSSNVSLLMADIRCLPGMEGCPVFGESAHLIGLLTRPLRQTGGAELQLVIPWEAIEAALHNSYQLEKTERDIGGLKGTHINSLICSTISIRKQPVDSGVVGSSVEKATTSVCLITIDNGVWASGVLLNNKGLILTNAHLLEPWRFFKTTYSGNNGNRDEKLYLPSQHSTAPKHKAAGNDEISIYYGYRQIRVRLDHVNPWVWHKAKVLYVSKGPLDISLLQLDSVPDDIRPVTVDLSCPSVGSKAFVIGHGLFGPRCELFPSICSGVVAKVVKARMPAPHPSSLPGNVVGEFPVMLQTTAAVHPGGSGGAVVNSAGHMIGLVTSNAKHGGGAVVPHMNFSIPCAALEPIFKFSEDMENLLLLQELEKPDVKLSSVWALMPPLSPEAGPRKPGWDYILKNDDEKQGKGSRFAKFIAERPELFKGLSQQKIATSLSPDTIPSKL
ncbi:hypothetical protein Dimus_035223 [Dionaea muscipula]